MVKKKLLRFRERKDRQLIAVLERYQLGFLDSHERGIWYTEKDLPAIRKAMEADPRSSYLYWNGQAYLYTDGKTSSRHVFAHDFEDALG